MSRQVEKYLILHDDNVIFKRNVFMCIVILSYCTLSFCSECQISAENRAWKNK